MFFYYTNIQKISNTKSTLGSKLFFSMQDKPIIVNDTVVLLLRFVAESLGCDVGWDNDIRTITITYSR